MRRLVQAMTASQKEGCTIRIMTALEQVYLQPYQSTMMGETASLLPILLENLELLPSRRPLLFVLEDLLTRALRLGAWNSAWYHASHIKRLIDQEETDEDKKLRVYQGYARACLMTGRHGLLNETVEEMSRWTSSSLALTKMSILQIRSKILEGAYQEALDIGSALLDRSEISKPHSPPLHLINRFLLTQKIKRDINNLPSLKDPFEEAVMTVMGLLLPIARTLQASGI